MNFRFRARDRKAANGVDLLVITIPLKSIPSLPRDLLFNLPASSPIIDTGDYYPLRDGIISEINFGFVRRGAVV